MNAAAQSTPTIRADAALDAELALIGCLMSAPRSIADADVLRPDDFYEGSDGMNGRLLAAMREEAARGVEAGFAVLDARYGPICEAEGLGRDHLFQVWDKAPPTSELPGLVAQVATAAAQRRLARLVTRPGVSPAELHEVVQAEARALDVIGSRGSQLKATPFTWRDAASIPPRGWLYDQHLIRRFPSVTFAPGAVGKTMLLIVEALAMVTGRPLLGSKPREPMRVWLINLEDPREEIERRVAAACLHYGINPEEIGGRLFIDSGREAEVVIARSTRGGVEVCTPCVRQLEREIQVRGIDVLIVDPFVACHEVPENDNGAINVVVKQWSALADRTGCAVELVHHVRKASASQAETTVEDGRGASALLAAVRSARVLNSMTEDQAAEWGIEQRRLYFRVDNGKANLAPPAASAKWRRLVDVDLCNGPSGFSDRVGVPAIWEPPSTFDGITNAQVYAIQQKVAAGDYRSSDQAGAWVGFAVAEVLGLDPTDQRDKGRIKKLIKAWMGGGALKTEMRTDPKKREQKPFVAVGEWVRP